METTLPLLGKKIVVTRAAEQASSLSKKIEQYGGIPIEVPLIQFQPAEEEKIKAIIPSLPTYDWLIFTSKNGIRFFMEAIGREKKQLEHVKIAVVGEKTAQYLKNYGLFPVIVPNEFVAESLLEQLLPHVEKGERVMLVKGNLARDLLPKGLEQRGIVVNEFIVYETAPDQSGMKRLRLLLQEEKVDIITFTSSSTVDNFIKALNGWKLEQLNGIKLASIGPITSATIEKYGLKVDIAASEYTTNGLMEAIIKSVSRLEGRL